MKWITARTDAAKLVADGVLSNDEIAAKVGVPARTLDNWIAHPEFAARVSELVEAYREKVRSSGIGVVENRVAQLDARWKLLQQVIAERAADETIHHVPGGKTGLIVRQTKFVKVYESVPRKVRPDSIDDESWDDDGPEPEYDTYPTKRTELVEEFAVDTGLLSEIRAHELQAAKELGQLTEKRDITSGGKTLGELLTGLSDEDLAARIAEAEGRTPDASVSP